MEKNKVKKKNLWVIVLALLLCTAYPQNQLSAQIVGNKYPKEGLVERIQKIVKASKKNVVFDAIIIKDVQVPAINSPKNLSVEQALARSLSSTEFTYKILPDGSYVIISREKQTSSQPTVISVPLSGTVSEENGEPIPGVSVIIKGTNKGTTTDLNGKYSLTNVSNNAALVFSFIGYNTLEQTVTENRNLNATLTEATNELNEVVVIGYGTTQKKDLTGAIASIDGGKISPRQNTQIISALQGAISGVTITRSSSAPGTAGSIRVRGITTIGNSDPLIIVDGVPVNSMNDVNPMDVENVTVLKDAASASIYGARAAAGVVLITTKRGGKSGVSVDYNYNYSLDIPTEMPDYYDATNYMKAQNELAWNDNPAGGEYALHDKDLIDNYNALHQENPDLYPDTDWAAMCLKANATRQSHLLSITSGGQKTRTKASFGYDDVEGLFKKNLSWNRVTARINNDIKLYSWLSATVDINLKLTDAVNPAYSPSSQMRYSAPIYSAEYSDGRVSEGKAGTNCYGKMMYGGTDETKTYQGGGKISIDITPFEGLKVSGVFAPNYTFSKDKEFQIRVPYTNYDNPDVVAGYLEGAGTTMLTENRNDNYSLTSQLFANYTKSIARHNFNLMAGYEDYYYYNESLMASRDKYQLDYYPYLDAGPGELKDNSGTAYENAYHSYFARLMYNYKNAYYFQANVRRDGSSRFYKDYRWGTFPSFSAGWIISEERFMKAIPLISFLKLRGSWGQLGNERIGNYPYQTSIEFNNPVLYVGNTPTSAQGASAYQYAIRDISWETTESTDFGFDMDLFSSRLRITADYYHKTTKDMLLKLQIPSYMGYTDPDQNAGSMKTKGWEVELGWNDHIGELNYGLTVNLSDYKSIMGDMKGTQVLGTNTITKDGTSYNEWYGYVSDGIFQSTEEITAETPVTSSSVTAGDIRYKDISGPDGVPDGKISADYDRVPLGGSLPRYNYGGAVNMSYKGIDFMMAFQGVGKQKSLMTEEMARPLRAQWYNVPSFIADKYWSKNNTAEQNAAAEYPRFSDTSGSNNYAISDFWLFNGAYLRIKNITLGYTLPQEWTSKALIQKLRLYVTLSDFFTFSHYPKGWDPEVSSTGYPITKSVMFGASVKF
ncbi:SusC/RagA family TonB-linked outer membrane protein [uncultured Bacteroides sp.]|uniref:SusC/RagA family TonB-linked outer membrane protein n=1 Tax=uncultured Bacteroides sp. TaxID=162156 RepID=UPI002AA8C545|nr:SusC/RagA family TonB-linked outer membrane protein [uncultured Bacteroides sp.]